MNALDFIAKIFAQHSRVNPRAHLPRAPTRVDI